MEDEEEHGNDWYLVELLCPSVALEEEEMKTIEGREDALEFNKDLSKAVCSENVLDEEMA